MRAVLQAARRSGLKADELLREAGLDPERVAHPEHGLSSTELDALWRRLGERAGPGFGLNAAEGLSRGALGGPEYALRASATLAEGLSVLAELTRRAQAEGGYELRPEPGGGAALVYDLPYAEGAERLAVGFALGAVLVLGRDAAGVRWTPRLVRVQHAAGREPAYAEFFGVPVRFDQPENALILSPDVLALPMREADPILAELLVRHLRQELRAHRPVQSLAEAVRAAILAALPEQGADLDNVARRVGVSSRVLQKRLQHSGTSFQELLDDVRVALAKRYLLQPTASLTATAIQLGYSDVTAFHRAFKRWTGSTPGDYRRQLGRDPLLDDLASAGPSGRPR